MALLGLPSWTGPLCIIIYRGTPLYWDDETREWLERDHCGIPQSLRPKPGYDPVGPVDAKTSLKVVEVSRFGGQVIAEVWLPFERECLTWRSRQVKGGPR